MPAQASSGFRPQLRNARSDPVDLRGEIQCLEAGQHLLFIDSEGIARLPTLLHDLGDSAPGDGESEDVAEFFEDGQLFFGQDPQCFVELPACPEDLGDLAAGDGA